MIRTIIEVRRSDNEEDWWTPLGEIRGLGLLPAHTSADESLVLSWLSCGERDTEYYDFDLLPVHHKIPRGLPETCSGDVLNSYSSEVYDYITKSELEDITKDLSIPFKCIVNSEQLQAYRDTLNSEPIIYPHTYYALHTKGKPKGTEVGKWTQPLIEVEPQLLALMYSLSKLYFDYRILWWLD